MTELAQVVTEVTNIESLADLSLDTAEHEHEEALRKVSWLFGITYAILFGGSLTF